MRSNKVLDRPDDIQDEDSNTYSCVRYLARGGFSKVYQVKRNNLQQNCGVIQCGKFIVKDCDKRDERDVFKEIEIHRRLKHKNVLQLRNCLEDDKYFCLILEYCGNNSMSELIKRRERLTEVEVRFFAKQVLAGVKYLHNNRVVHRDLKPQNILINRNMVLKIADFGMATEVISGGRMGGPLGGRIRKKAVYGTPTYISPEMVNPRIKTYDYKVDIWAIGVLLYDMFVGRPPFLGTSVTKICEAVAACRYDIPSGVPYMLSSLIKKILVLDPAKRPDIACIQRDQFFTTGFSPTTLPISALVEPPKFLDNAHDIQVLDHRFGSSSAVIRSSWNNRCSSNNRRSNVQSRLLRASVITCSQPSHLNFCDRSCSRAVFNRLRYEYAGMLIKKMTLSSWQESDLEAPHLDPVVWISELVDCPYPIGCVAYCLNNGHVGAMFNDESVVSILSAEFVQYSDRRTNVRQVWRMHECPIKLKNKVDTLRLIFNYTDGEIGARKLAPAISKDSAEWIGLVPDMVYYETTPFWYVTVLSTGLLQINYKHTKVRTLLCPKLRAFSVIKDEDDIQTYYLNSLDKYGHPKEIHELLANTFVHIARLLTLVPCFYCRKQFACHRR